MRRTFATLLVGAALASPATGQTFEIEAPDGTICSAFAYAPGLVATAAHCITSQRVELSLGGYGDLIAIGVFENRFLSEAQQTEQDVAILATARQLPRSVPISTRPLDIGQEVHVEPPGFGFRRCFVAGRSGDAYDLDCLVEDGWSGAPVYASGLFGSRRLVGLISGRASSLRGGDMAIMVHARVLPNLLKTN